jgi:diguanylate cyclase (GGDEF)-like protein/PAS domain S-box-containing protein
MSLIFPRIFVRPEVQRAVFHGSTILALLLIGVVWIIAGLHVEGERTAAERAAVQNSTNLAGAFEEHLSRSLNEIDRSIKVIRAEYLEAPGEFDLRGWLNRSQLFDDQTLQVSIVSRDGYITASSVVSASSVGTDLRDREHFKFQASATDDQLFISKPVVGRTTGKWSIQLTRRIVDADGVFDGMIVASLDPAYLARFYDSVNLGTDGYVRVIGVDGIIRAASGGRNLPLGKNFSGGDLFGHFAKEAQGWFYTESRRSDSVPRLVTYRGIKNYPLIITVGLATSEIFSSVNANKRTYFLLAALLSVLIVLVMIVGIRGRILRNRMTRERGLQNQRLDAVLRNMPLGVCLVDDDGRLSLSNERFRSMYGVPADLVTPGTRVRDIVQYRAKAGTFVGNVDEFYKGLVSSLAQGSVVRRTTELGDGRTVSVLSQPVAGGGWVSIHEDTTEQHAAREHLQQTKRFLDSIIENVPIPIVVKDAASRRFVLVNQAFERFFGRPRSQLIDRTAFDLYPLETAKTITESDDEAVRTKERKVNVDLPLATPAMGSRSVTTTRLVVTDAHGEPKYIITVIEDITDKKKAHAKIAHMAHHDPLTELPNRARFSERLDEALSRVNQGVKLAVLFLDLDHFKTVNDSLGHPIGDELLRVVAERLRTCVADTDTVARLGGDEFAIIQCGASDPSEISSLAERIRVAVTAPYDLGGLRAIIDVSIGIVRAPRDGIASSELMKRADLALYRAKADGRGKHCFFEPDMDARMQARRVLETDLRHAIVRGEFRLLYQPIMNIGSGRIDGVEALLRWQHPERGLVPPVEFINAAEETGLIVPLGEWVIRQACADAARWPADISIAVNLSPVQFSSKNLVSVVLNALASSGISPRRLELELTEEMLLGHSPANLSVLKSLRGAGVRIVMDDFGTGYSSLSYLRSFEFDKIKIDRSFVTDLTAGNELSLAIVQSVASLATVLKISTTAEGVETAEQLALVREAGCTHYQGYLLGKPMQAADIDSLFVQTCDQSHHAA